MNDPNIFRSNGDGDDQSPGLEALRAANPVPTEELTDEEQARSEAVLQDILAEPADAGDEDAITDEPATGQRRGKGFALVAAAAVAVLAIATVPLLRGTTTPTATATEVLTSASEAAAAQPSLSDTFMMGDSVQNRTDHDATGTVTTVTKVDVLGEGIMEQQAETQVGEDRLSQPLAELTTNASKFDHQVLTTDRGDTLIYEIARDVDESADSVAELREFLAEQFSGDIVRGGLNLLLVPGLNPQLQATAYEVLAGAEGVDVEDRGERQVTLRSDGMTFRIFTETGQLAEVRGLVAPGVTTTVQATGMVGCVNVAALDGPEDVSLACADNNYFLSDLEWQDWGEDQATATGTAWVNDCDPSCAESKVEPQPVAVTVDQRQTCGQNLDVYTKLRVSYDSDAPAPFVDEDFDLACK